MESRFSWWYWQNTQPKYITDIGTVYGERSASGWTSSLGAPRIDEKIEIYTETGEQWHENITDQIGLNAGWNNFLSAFAGNNTLMPCGGHCSEGWYDTWNHTLIECTRWSYDWCETGGGGGGPTFPSPPPPIQLYYVKRVQVVMPDGSNHEFRASDTPINCGTNQTGCTTDLRNGTFLSVDGSGMKLVRDDDNQNANDGSILLLPDGSKYKFPDSQQSSADGISAVEFTDNSGNKSTFSAADKKWTDTLGREIIDPMPQNWLSQTQSPGTNEIDLLGLAGNPQNYKVKWDYLKPRGCELKTQSECATLQGHATSGALEDQDQKLYWETRYFCQGLSAADLLNDPDHPNEVLFPEQESGIRPCNSFDVLRDSEGNPILIDGHAQPYATRFNPVVLSEVELPNGKKYIFKYNRYGEISKIVYPTGSYETFVYSYITPISGVGNPAYDQTNRGVTERKVYDAAGTLQQRWQYAGDFNYASGGNSTYKVTTIAPKGDNALGEGVKSERLLHFSGSTGDFGFNDPRAGIPNEERTYDENHILRSRTLTEFITKDNGNAKRDARVKRTVSVAIENNQALATLSETEYNETGTTGNNAQTDAEYFSHLDVKRAKGYHYTVIPVSTAQTGNLTAIAGYFNDYINFIIATPRDVTATEAERVQPESTNAPAHDAFTRLLQRLEPDAETLWQESRTQIDFASGILVLDDSTLEKPFSKNNALVYQYWSGNQKAVVSGINLITLLWTDGVRCVPVDYRVFDKDRDGKTKNDHFSEMLMTAFERGFQPKLVCFDSWYASIDNLKLVRSFGWHFLTRLKANRQIRVGGGKL